MDSSVPEEELIIDDFSNEEEVRARLLSLGVLPTEPHVPKISQKTDPLMAKLSSAPETSLVDIEKVKVQNGAVYSDEKGNRYQINEVEDIWQVTGIKGAMLALTFPTKEEVQKYITEKDWKHLSSPESEIEPKPGDDPNKSQRKRAGSVGSFAAGS